MTFDQLNSLLKKVSYKPNAYFCASESPHCVIVRLYMEVPDVTIPNQTIIVNVQRSIPKSIFYDFDLTMFLHLIESLTTAIEQHETDEWLRYDNKPLNPPHGV